MSHSVFSIIGVRIGAKHLDVPYMNLQTPSAEGWVNDHIMLLSGWTFFLFFHCLPFHIHFVFVGRKGQRKIASFELYSWDNAWVAYIVYPFLLICLWWRWCLWELWNWMHTHTHNDTWLIERAGDGKLVSYQLYSGALWTHSAQGHLGSGNSGRLSVDNGPQRWKSCSATPLQAH